MQSIEDDREGIYTIYTFTLDLNPLPMRTGGIVGITLHSDVYIQAASYSGTSFAIMSSPYTTIYLQYLDAPEFYAGTIQLNNIRNPATVIYYIIIIYTSYIIS